MKFSFATAVITLGVVLTAACSPSAEDLARNLDEKQTPNPVVRQDTAKIAKNFGSDEVVAGLIVALGDSEEIVRLNAIDSLIELEATDAVDRLMEVVQKDPSEDVQSAAVDALGRLKDPKAAPVLVTYLEAHVDAPPLNAIWALGALGAEGVPKNSGVLEVLTTLRQNKDPYVQYNATVALRTLKLL